MNNSKHQQLQQIVTELQASYQEDFKEVNAGPFSLGLTGPDEDGVIKLTCNCYGVATGKLIWEDTSVDDYDVRGYVEHLVYYCQVAHCRRRNRRKAM